MFDVLSRNLRNRTYKEREVEHQFNKAEFTPLKGRLRSSKLCQSLQKCTERRKVDKCFGSFGQIFVNC